MSFISRLIVKHWTVERKLKDDKQEEREKWLCLYIPIIPFNRWILFASAFLIQFCCGSLYSWSVFNAPIDTLIYHSSTANRAVISFYIAVGMFGFTSMLMGPWLERNGPRRGVMLGSTMFLLGHVITAISVYKKNIAGVYIGYGVFAGFGLGLNYISPVSALQKWFPDYRGIASGFAVGGFGAGSVVWSKVYLPLISAVGLSQTFAVLGAMLFCTKLFCAIALRTPPNDFNINTYTKYSEESVSATADEKGRDTVNVNTQVEEIDKIDSSSAAVLPPDAPPTNKPLTYTLTQAIFSADFFFLYIVFFANEVFGLVALSRLANMCSDLFGKSAAEGANIVAINGVFNCCGRLFLPMLSDLAVYILGNRCHPATPRKVVYFVTLVVQLIIVSVLPSLISSQNFNGFCAALWILTGCYGGGFGTIPALLTNLFGALNIGAMHGIILTAWSIGGVGGGLGFTGNYEKYKATNIREAYEDNFTWILAILAVGLGLLWLVRTDPKDRAAEGYRFSIFGRKIFHVVFI